MRKAPPLTEHSPSTMAIFLICFQHKELQVKPSNHRYFTVERQVVEKGHSRSSSCAEEKGQESIRLADVTTLPHPVS